MKISIAQDIYSLHVRAHEHKYDGSQLNDIYRIVFLYHRFVSPKHFAKSKCTISKLTFHKTKTLSYFFSVFLSSQKVFQTVKQ